MNPKKKKIIIIGPAYPYRGGNSLFVSFVFDALIEKFDVKIYNYKLLYPSLLFPGTTQFDKSNVIIKKAPNERIVNSINPFNWISTAAKLKKENADLVVFDWWHPFFGLCHFTISALIKKYYRNRILFITENVVSHEGNFIDKTLTKLGLTFASKFLALSEVVEKELRTLTSNKKIFRSELPVYDCYQQNELKSTKSEFGFSEKDKVILFFGYVRKYKGLDILLDAFSHISQIYPGIKLLIVGEFYDDPEEYLNKIKQNNIENDVTMINEFVPNEEVGKYYSAADLVILPYRSATQSGILNVAYGFLKPVVVTRVGGLSEFVQEGKTGFVIEPNSAEAITKGVQKYYSMRDQIDFERNIKNFISSNRFEKLPQLLEDIIEESSK